MLCWQESRRRVLRKELLAASGALQVLSGVVAGRRWVARLSAGRASLEWGVDTYRGAKLLGAAVTPTLALSLTLSLTPTLSLALAPTPTPTLALTR